MYIPDTNKDCVTVNCFSSIWEEFYCKEKSNSMLGTGDADYCEHFLFWGHRW